MVSQVSTSNSSTAIGFDERMLLHSEVWNSFKTFYLVDSQEFNFFCHFFCLWPWLLDANARVFLWKFSCFQSCNYSTLFWCNFFFVMCSLIYMFVLCLCHIYYNTLLFVPDSERLNPKCDYEFQIKISDASLFSVIYLIDSSLI